jgi:electron transfer flavoprotein beta subunit
VIVLVCLEPPAPGPASRTALALACGLGDKARIFALTLGGPTQNATLDLARACAPLARVLHIEAPELDPTDATTKGLILAEAARYLEAGLIVAGERSGGEGQGLVPAAIAHHLRAPIVARVRSVRFDATSDRLEVTTRAGGRLCTLHAPAPLVLTTAPDFSAPTPPTADAPHALAPLSLVQIGLDASRLVRRPDLLGAKMSAPPVDPREVTWAEARAALARHT